MRRKLTTSLVSVVLVVLVQCVPALAYVTPEQAMQAVREFESDPALTLEVLSLHDDPAFPFYHIRGGNDATYQVCAESARVQSAVYINNESLQLSPHEVPALAMPIDQAQAIALPVARQHYPNFDSSGLTLEDQRLNGRSYEFTWGEVLQSNGAATPNFCAVEVAADTGKLVSYAQGIEVIPPEAHRLPTVSGQQALDAALAAVGGVQATNVSQDLEYGDGALIWGIKMDAIDANGESETCWVDVDADTGDVLFTDYAMSAAQPGLGSHAPFVSARRDGTHNALAPLFRVSWLAALALLAASSLLLVRRLRARRRCGPVGASRVGPVETVGAPTGEGWPGDCDKEEGREGRVVLHYHDT